MLVNVFKIILSLWERLGCIIILYFGCLASNYLSGVLVAIKAKRWRPGKNLEGIWKIVGSLFAVMVGGTLDLLIEFMNVHFDPVNISIGNIPMFCCLVLVWCIAFELGSIIKNARKLGHAMPRFLEYGIEKLRKTIEEPPKGAVKDNTESHKYAKNEHSE